MPLTARRTVSFYRFQMRHHRRSAVRDAQRQMEQALKAAQQNQQRELDKQSE